MISGNRDFRLLNTPAPPDRYRRYSIIAACILSILLYSCVQQHQAEPAVNFSITSPKEDWVYYEDSPVLLALNINTEDIRWVSSVSGYLGKGNHLPVYLIPGSHTVTASSFNIKKEIHIFVSRRELKPEDEIRTLINYTPLSKPLHQGAYYPYLISLNGFQSGLSISSVPPIRESSGKEKTVLFRNIQDSLPLKDFRPQLPRFTGEAVIKNRNIRTADSNTLYNTAETRIGSKHSFFVMNTGTPGSNPHKIEAELLYRSARLSVWLPQSAETSAEEIQKCIEAAESIIVPRVTQLWGSWADINSDGTVSILFSPTINEEGSAIGFFNPSDFFKHNSDTSSENYNPASNEMDIIYIAAPDSSEGSQYNTSSIIATIAHELTHAATFTQKTWKRICEGEYTAPQEELFLDEGWSHLSENLCGFGISGGNIAFMQRFFDDTGAYSFCGKNTAGQDDSAGMRGAMLLFLSRLFRETGGMSWDADNPARLIDKGGISFLRSMVNSSGTGWESIGSAYGETTDSLFSRMVTEINRRRTENTRYISASDPMTGEPVDFFCNTITGSEKNTPIIGFPRTFPQGIQIQYTSLPYSFRLFKPFTLDTPANLVLNAEKTEGAVFYAYITAPTDYKQ